MTKRTAVVMTTIHPPVVVDSYANNAERYGHLDDVFMIVIPDRKTPDEAREMCEKASRSGFDVDYVTLDRQEAWLERYPDLASLIPYDSDNRRNIGFLMALERGCEVLISIDDDNYCPEDEDYYAEHGRVGEVRRMPEIRSSTGWFNICGMMENTHDQVIYPRGFPYAQRHDDVTFQESSSDAFVSVNAGLWSHDPDVDAVTRLNRDVKTTELNRDSVMLGPGTKTPVNTQNTALWAGAIPAYYYILMGEPIHGSRLDRYGDIWSGYFLGRCARHLDHRIAVGTPVAHHDRNAHNLFDDLRHELWGMILTESLVETLDALELEGDDYGSAYRSLADRLEDAVAAEDGKYFDERVKAYFSKVCGAMRVWVDVCEDLAPVGQS